VEHYLHKHIFIVELALANSQQLPLIKHFLVGSPQLGFVVGGYVDISWQFEHRVKSETHLHMGFPLVSTPL
jgi:hypothetical protein